MSQIISDRIDPGSWILEQLTLILPDVEMAAGRRAWHEAKAAWPGQEGRLWWKWTVESVQSIGLTAKTVDCTVREAVQLLHSGARLITWDSSDATESADSQGEWVLLQKFGSHKCELSRAGKLTETSNISLRKAKRLLKGLETDGRVRCVAVRTDVSLATHEEKRLKPFARAWSLLKPEWSDIWVVLVFAFVTGLLMLATPIAVESLVNTVAFGRFLQPVIVLAGILLTFLGFSAAMKALQTYIVELVQRRLFARVAGDLAYRLPRTRVQDTDGIYLPELVNRFFDIVTVQKVAAQLLLDGVGLILTAGIGMAVLGFYHPWLLGFDVVMMASIAFIIFVLGRGAIASAVKESKHKYYMASWLEDITRCPTAFRTAGGTALALERADRLVHEYLEARQKHFGILMRQVVFALGLQAVASTALLGIGGWLVISGQLTLGQLVAAELIVTVIVGAFAKLGKHMESFYDLLASVDKLGALFDLPTEHHDGVMDLTSVAPARLLLEDVRYSGKSGGKLTTVINAKVGAGESCAVLGPSGSGKSTLLDMVYGMRLPTAGHITIDDYDPNDLRPDVLRNHVALVRRSEIFHGTVEENVHLHRTNVTSADVRQATDAVGLYDLVLRMPDGFETRLNGDGAPLSDTQRDLLSLARAIAGNPRLLLVDGAFDALSDEELNTALSFVLAAEREWTVVISTGRVSIAERCQQIIDLRPNRPTAVVKN